MLWTSDENFDCSVMDNEDVDTATGAHALTRSTEEEEDNVTHWQWIQDSVVVKRDEDSWPYSQNLIGSHAGLKKNHNIR